MSEIPLVIIAYNNLTFVKKFIEQTINLTKKIIILDNKSEYNPLFEYYKYLEETYNNKFDIRRLTENYGHMIYRILGHTLPEIYVLSDPDLQLNPYMPNDCFDKLLYISNKYKSNKVGVALDISDYHDFIKGPYGDLIFKIESSYYVNTNVIPDSEFKLFNAPIDTTFCLINNTVSGHHSNIRVGGNFTAKHLPWYQDYLKIHIPKEELVVWIKNNKSSSILEHIDINNLLN
jgi:hypothetical protein